MHVVSLVIVAALSSSLIVPSLEASQSRQGPPSKIPLQAQKIRDGLFRIGSVEVDTTKKELRVPATINKDVTVLEFVANQPNGSKSYESALTLDTYPTILNAALLLMGLDPSHARVPVRHFDPIPPKGDPVELFVEWTADGAVKRVNIEELLMDKRTNTTLPVGPWVYTGSAMINGSFMAELDGVMIGFVHSPSPLIENPRSGAVDAFGFFVPNPRLGLSGGTKVTLIIKALPVGKTSTGRHD